MIFASAYAAPRRVLFCIIMPAGIQRRSCSIPTFQPTPRVCAAAPTSICPPGSRRCRHSQRSGPLLCCTAAVAAAMLADDLRRHPIWRGVTPSDMSAAVLHPSSAPLVVADRCTHSFELSLPAHCPATLFYSCKIPQGPVVLVCRTCRHQPISFPPL